ncbi:MAG: leucine-rich repeat domain-containing protein, partial [Candidatus Methanomethylophilaceae archaeon]|nr:leucine-rich repeat domain-containing protein [Candidatus Methanomethylophilaceae archaeon]
MSGNRLNKGTSGNGSDRSVIMPFAVIALLVMASAMVLLVDDGVQVEAEGGSCGSGLTWELSGDTLKISKTGEGTGEMTDFHKDNKPPWYEKDYSKAVIGDGVKSIGTYAFRESKMVEITIADSVAAIGEGAFALCGSLEEIEVPASVKAIEYGTFLKCVKLEVVNLPRTLTSIGEDAFYGCHSLPYVELPADLEVIGEQAFADCQSLITALIPSKVKEIGPCAYADCPYLQYALFMPGCTMIAEAMFYMSNGLEMVYIPSTVKDIGESAFDSVAFYDNDGTTLLSYKDLPGYEYKGGNEKLVRVSERSIIIAEGECGNGVTWTYDDAGNLVISKTGSGNGAMWDYDTKEKKTPWYQQGFQVNTVLINDGVTSIGNYALNGAATLTYVSIPSTVKTIGDKAFAYCVQLSEIEIPEGVTSIGANVFDWCMKLSDVSLPSTLETFGDKAFSGCRNLEEITIPGSLKN